MRIYMGLYRRGDINYDGAVTAEDALLVMRHTMGLIELSGLEMWLADVNWDDKVDTEDALILLRYVMGVIDSLPY